MIEAKNGLVIRYHYLWAREHERGEDSGRKDRPVCVQIVLKASGGATLAALFPITSQKPQAERSGLEIPEIEARRVGLRRPCWVMIDEFDTDDLATSAHVAETQPLGALSASFMRQLREAAAQRIRASAYKKIPR